MIEKNESLVAHISSKSLLREGSSLPPPPLYRSPLYKQSNILNALTAANADANLSRDNPYNDIGFKNTNTDNKNLNAEGDTTIVVISDNCSKSKWNNFMESSRCKIANSTKAMENQRNFLAEDHHIKVG